MGVITEYYRATSCDDAHAKAKSLGSAAAYVGGGVELVLRRNPEVATLIDLSRCGLGRIVKTAEALSLGAQVTLAAISRNGDVKAYAGGSLAYLAGHIAHNNLRNMITIGGAIGRNQPWNDIVPHLIALGAYVEIQDDQERVMPLSDFIRQREPGTLILGVRLPLVNADLHGFLWRFTRTQQDISLLHCSALIGVQESVVSAATIVYAGRPGGTVLYPKVAAELIGRPVKAETFLHAGDVAAQAVEVGDDLRASGSYRRELVRAAMVRLGEEMAGVAQ